MTRRFVYFPFQTRKYSGLSFGCLRSESDTKESAMSNFDYYGGIEG